MIVGIDVFHDKSKKSGSVAGVVCSRNDNLSKFYSTVAIQKDGQELLDAVKVINSFDIKISPRIILK